jgi:hypothetical protein
MQITAGNVHLANTTFVPPLNFTVKKLYLLDSKEKRAAGRRTNKGVEWR